MSFHDPSDRDADSDDDGFMEQVNVYLNTRSSKMQDSNSALEGILRRDSSFNKQVKFAMDLEELEDAQRDNDRTRQELMTKIERLTEMLKEAEEQITNEKDKRKKKEKNLMKLAKELKKRNAQREEAAERMEELEEKKKYLEHHWVLAQKELDQEKALRQKLQNESQDDFVRALKEEKERYSKLSGDHESRIADLKQAHAKQCDELCREILKANLEADRLHTQLNGSDAAPRKVKLFSDPSADSKKGIPMWLVVFSMAIAVGVYSGYQVQMFTKDSLCSPVMPGLTLERADAGATFQAPWWAPADYKDQAFEFACSTEAPPTTLEWLPDGNFNKVVVTNNGKAVFTRKGIVKADVFGERLRIWNRKGLAEDKEGMWSIL